MVTNTGSMTSIANGILTTAVFVLLDKAAQNGGNAGRLVSVILSLLALLVLLVLVAIG